ncbi:MAG: alpha/beta hydrolase [Magnetococcales bacterium]|nr:alpha/beta hydrolase [Magnetococcales bacterium]
MSNQPLGTVILIHGLWMRGLEFFWMRRHLQALGYQVAVFRYATVRVALTQSTESLYHLWRHIPPPVYLLGHSLGGLLALHLLHRYEETRGSRLVAVGTPFLGSHSARILSRLPWVGRRVLGGSLDNGLLYGGPNRVPDGCQVGVVAGTLSVGFSRALFALESPNDGTVAVAETQLPGAQVVQLPHTHMGLVVSRRVVELACDFFKEGLFHE